MEGIFKAYGKTETPKSRRKRLAQKRTEQRLLRTPKQQLAALDKRLGAGVGAKRERKRLAEGNYPRD